MGRDRGQAAETDDQMAICLKVILKTMGERCYSDSKSWCLQKLEEVIPLRS